MKDLEDRAGIMIEQDDENQEMLNNEIEDIDSDDE
jgi:hypothetical protein